MAVDQVIGVLCPRRSGDMSGEWETEMREVPSSLSRKMEYNLWHPNQQRPMSDEATVAGRSTGQRRRGDGGTGGRGGRASSDLGGHRVGSEAARRPDGGDAVDGGRVNRTEGRFLHVSRLQNI